METNVRSRSLAAVALALVVLTSMAVVGATLATAPPSPSATPTGSLAVLLSPSTSPTVAPSPSEPPPSDAPSPSDSPSLSPSPSPTPTPRYTGPFVATRVVVPSLGIDLAVTKSPPVGVYPYCNVAMAFGKPFGQPGQARATYLFAHARTGMFGPIYELTMVKRTPRKMIGMLVDVYTSDSMVHEYRITKVLPHQTTLTLAASTRRDELWLQTSEGPHGTPGKTQVVAEPVSVAPASYEASHPRARIVRCG